MSYYTPLFCPLLPLTFFIPCSLVHLVSHCVLLSSRAPSPSSLFIIPPPPTPPSACLLPLCPLPRVSSFLSLSLSLSLIVKHLWLEYWGANHYSTSTAQCSGRMSILPPPSVILSLSLPRLHAFQAIVNMEATFVFYKEKSQETLTRDCKHWALDTCSEVCV